MGGIAGWVAAPERAREPAAIAPMLAALAHRGQGEPAVFAFGNRTVLGASGPQPLYDGVSGIAAALDGTICNREELRAQLRLRGYRFEADRSDEVLLAAYQYWDKDVAKHLRGAFAFAIWDARKERLLLARDRFGEKPLFLHESGGALSFASEIKALLEIPGLGAKVDLSAVWDCLAYRYVPGPRTLFAGIRKLPPGTSALWQFGRLREQRYWFPPDRAALVVKGGDAEPVAGFIEKLDESVKLRMAGDGTPGAFLSGGFDSAAMVALMTRHSSRISTFSAGLAEDRASELPAAARAAKHFGTLHHEIVLSPGDLVAQLPRLVAVRDAPVSQPSDIALHLLAREAARSVKAVLTGDGGDEVLGGYRRHAAERYAWLFRGLWRERSGARRVPLRGLAAGPRPASDGGAPVPGLEADPRASRLRRMLYLEQSSWLPDHLLERGDRMTMAASLEARAPFLDHRLAEYVSGLPDAMRVRGLSTKWVLRRAGARLVPRRALAPRKGGFRLPAAEWLRGDMRELMVEHLRGPASRTRAYYDAPVLDRAIDEHLAGRKNHQDLLWTLLNLEIWHRAYLPA